MLEAIMTKYFIKQHHLDKFFSFFYFYKLTPLI